MIRIIQDGEDMVWQAYDRGFGGAITESLRLNGLTGVVKIGGVAQLGGTLAGFTSSSGAYAYDLSASTGAFKTSTGANTLEGNVTIAANKALSMASGTGSVDLSAASGAMKTTTGLFTFEGKSAATATANLIADPGNGGAIPVTSNGVCALTSAGSETRTLADPTFIGQILTIDCDVYVGNIVVTGAHAVDSAAHTHITYSAAGQSVSLVCVQVAGSKVWRLLHNDGAALS